jgi:hypothetical protein
MLTTTCTSEPDLPSQPTISPNYHAVPIPFLLSSFALDVLVGDNTITPKSQGTPTAPQLLRQHDGRREPQGESVLQNARAHRKKRVEVNLT